MVKNLLTYSSTLEGMGFLFHGDGEAYPQELQEDGVRLLYSALHIEGAQVNFYEIPSGLPESQTRSALSRMDAAILLVPPTPAPDEESKRLWRLVEAMNLRGLVFVNAIDQATSSFAETLRGLKEHLSKNLLALNDPTEDEHTAFMKDSPELLGEEINAGKIVPLVFGSAKFSAGIYALLTGIAFMPTRQV